MSKSRIWRNDFICNLIVRSIKAQWCQMSFRGRSQLDLMLHLPTWWQINCGKGHRIYQKSSILKASGLWQEIWTFPAEPFWGCGSGEEQWEGRFPDWESPAESRVEAADGGSRGGSPAMSAVSGSTMRGPARNGSSEQRAPLMQDDGNGDERQQGMVPNEKYQD